MNRHLQSVRPNPECHVISLLNKQKKFFLPGAEARVGVGAGVGADWFIPGADENQTAPKNPGSALAHRYIPVVSIKKSRMFIFVGFILFRIEDVPVPGM